MSSPFWMTASLDLDPREHEEGLALWERLTGWSRSSPGGPMEEYVSLLPPRGDHYLDVQRLGDGSSRIHLDVHVADVPASTADLTRFGASIVADHGDYVVLESPGGFPFCFVEEAAVSRPQPTTWPAGHSSYVDQVCLDIPPSTYDAELDFWHRLTGWERRDPKPGSEFGRLNPPPGQPLQLLMQRLDEDEARVRAHLDWSSTDRLAEIERHQAAGSELVERFEGWTVLRGPAGVTYCITGRRPLASPA